MVTNLDKEHEVARLQPGDYFGEASLLTGATRNASVEALVGNGERKASSSLTQMANQIRAFFASE